MLILGRPLNQGAGAWLRCAQHLSILDRSGLASCPVLDEMQDDPDLAWKAKCLADVFVGAGWPIGGMFDLIAKWADGGRKWVWDIDDDPSNVSPYNFAYEFFGLEEVELKEPIKGEKWLWRNGVGEFDTERNRERHDQFFEMLKNNVAAITTTTPYLAEKLKRFASDVPIYIRPNVLDFGEIWKNRRRESKDGKIRILYQGGASHGAALDYVLPVLQKIAIDFPHAQYVFQGDTKGHAARMIPEDRIETFGWSFDYSTFAYRMADIGADIAIAPLCMDPIHAEFNRCKSSLKWLDAAALAIPCVSQADTPYREVVTKQNMPDISWNGLLAKTHEEWYESLAHLISVKDMREVIGNNAQREAYMWWSAEDFAGEHMKQYEEVVNGNSNAAPMANETSQASRN